MSSSNVPQAVTSTASASEGLNALRPRMSYVAYHVSDVERALAFYGTVLGMKEQMRLDLGGGVHEVVLTFPEAPAVGLILMWNEKRTEPYRLGDGYSRLVVRVSDVDAAMELLARHGVVVVKPATDAGSLRYSLVNDPDGYVVEFLQFKR